MLRLFCEEGRKIRQDRSGNRLPLLNRFVDRAAEAMSAERAGADAGGEAAAVSASDTTRFEAIGAPKRFAPLPTARPDVDRPCARASMANASVAKSKSIRLLSKTEPRRNQRIAAVRVCRISSPCT